VCVCVCVGGGVNCYQVQYCDINQMTPTEIPTAHSILSFYLGFDQTV